MATPATDRYFLAVVPPIVISREITEQKIYIGNKYKTRGALNSPPHITLHMPFIWKAHKEDELLSSISNFARGQNCMKLFLSGYDCFEPRVLFIKTEPQPELDRFQHDLHRFCKRELNLFNAQYKDLPFHPHITIAFRDLKKAEFYNAWHELNGKEFQREFTIDGIFIMKHMENSWQQYHRCALKS